MGSFKAKVRLYRKLDRDLMMLYRHPEFNLARAIQEAITMAARKEGGYIALPKPMHLSSYPKKIEFNVKLPDEDVLAWYRMIPEGFRNDTLKNLVRGYLAGPVISVAINQGGYDNNEFFNGKEKTFRAIPHGRAGQDSEAAKQYAEIEKLLKANGSTPEEFLKQLKESLSEEAEKSLIQETEDVPVPLSETPAQSQPKSEFKPDLNAEKIENSDFDVFSAVSNMIS